MSLKVKAEPLRRANKSEELGLVGATMRLIFASTAIASTMASLFSFGTSNTRSSFVYSALALISITVTLRLWRKPFNSFGVTPSKALAAAVAAFLALVAISTGVYLAVGSFTNPFDALYESSAGVSTSSLTLVADPQSQFDPATLIWRSATQWLGGWASLVLGIAILPNMAGSAENVDPTRSVTNVRRTKKIPTRLIRNATIGYAIATVVAISIYTALRLNPVDAVAHALSLVSSGGFSTRAESLAAFDSVAVIRATTAMMVLTGCSSVLIWLILKLDFHLTPLLLEARFYIAALILSIGWVWLLNTDTVTTTNPAAAGATAAATGAAGIPGAAQNLGVEEVGVKLSDAAFTVISMSTTTGFSITDWGGWHPGSTSLLVALIAVGGMAGSVAGGLRWYRLLGIGQFIIRELQRQLHPRVVRPVKVGRSLVTEASADRIHAQFAYVVVATAVGVLGIAAFGTDLTAAMTLATSAVATAGPGYDSAGLTITNASELSTGARAVLIPLMLAGRVFLFPAALAFFLWGRYVLRTILGRKK